MRWTLDVAVTNSVESDAVSWVLLFLIVMELTSNAVWSAVLDAAAETRQVT